jgi:uncharacterized protein YbaR (Trm112 family)/SAM-dependent methyltransferase
MSEPLLDLLRCPFCGGRFNLADGAPTVRIGGHLEAGVLWCECCVFPIVAGIPVLRADDTTRAVLAHLEAGDLDAALVTMLDLDDARAEAFRGLRARGDAATYREAIAVLSPDPEGTYFIYRFSDPTFVMAETIIETIGRHGAGLRGRVLDLCGGSGHLTRVLCRVAPDAQVVLADMFFWKLWLARTFTAPTAAPVCCDANQPLPFARGTFPTVVLSDAFPYIWHKRLLAEEMVRQVGADGLIVMPHLHSSLGWNYSAGMTLTPRSYADLFTGVEPRLFRDEDLLAQAIGGGGLDLSVPLSPEALTDANAVTLIASGDPTVFRQHAPPARAVATTLVVNPLYEVTRDGDASLLRLRFPTPEYEEEFGACRRYLPDTLRVAADLTQPVDADATTLDLDTLLRRRVLIDAPRRYC